MMLDHTITGPADAPTVVLGGSLGTTRSMWWPQLAALADEFRVVAYDHRGHGARPAPPGPYTIDQLGGPAFRAAHDEVTAPLRTAFRAIPAQGYAGCCEAIAGMDLRPVLPGIAAPTLVVAGADDPVTPPPYAERIAAAIPGALLTVVPDAAHLLSVQHPAAVSRLLQDHFGGGTRG